MNFVEQKVIEILEELSSSKVISVSQTLKNDLGMDSLNTVIMIVTIEEEFEIELSEMDMNPALFGTVENVINMVERYVKAKETYENK